MAQTAGSEPLTEISPEAANEAEGIDRRGFLNCMKWAGTGILWTLAGGLPNSFKLGSALAAEQKPEPFTFIQISDSHIGFNKPANPNTLLTLREAIDQIKTLPVKPAFMIHTGDISHLSKDKEFDDADQIIKEAGLPVFTVPGEHDLLDDQQGKAYLDRYSQGPSGKALGAGWYSFDQKGIHYIALVNVVDLQAGGLGHLGDEQLAWLARDVASLSSSTPIVIFAHIPLWTIYAEWGWGTEDGAKALAMLKRFGSVTVLNGHIHQIMQKVEGHVAFHTARSTAFPQPAPGTAPSPGPMKVPPEALRKYLGIATVDVIIGKEQLAITDRSLAG